ncbi:hypothetical protein MESS2_730078 [Mesorhizobium metallidurans STM 2683]|uniref:Uncharacterized protein n=1 Tax=Mesorhizobium metallidurans STM 2683 TaxID=1297569 RepID=M5EVA6_9HYPH|nr:hypothetical protein MESS2_730078 [Mesorhizobium metallidurans STM 2683]
MPCSIASHIAAPYPQHKTPDIGHLDAVAYRKGFVGFCPPALAPDEHVALAALPVEDLRRQPLHGLCANTRNILAGRPQIAAGQQRQAERQDGGGADNGPRHLEAGPLDPEQHGSAQQKRSHASQPKDHGRVKGFDDQEDDAKQHQGKAGIADRQEIECIEPEQKANRADHARRDRARARELEDETIDADQHQDDGDVRVRDDGEKPDEPTWLERFNRQPFRRQCLLFAGDLDGPAVGQLKQFGGVAGDEVDDMLLQRRAGRQAGRLAHGLFTPFGIAPAQFSQAADQGNGIVRRLGYHRIARRCVLLVLVRLRAIVLAAGKRWQRPAHLDRRCRAKIGAGRHRRQMGGVEDVGPGARRMPAGGRDIADDGNRRGEDAGDHLAHAGDQPAGRVHLQDESLDVSVRGHCQRFLELPGTRRTDGAAYLDAQHNFLPAVRLSGGGRGTNGRGSHESRGKQNRTREFHAQSSISRIWVGFCRNP